MTIRHFILFLAAISLVTALTGCGGLASSPAISVAFTASATPPASMSTGTTVSMAATAANDPNNRGINWTVTCAGSQCGSFKPSATGNGVTSRFTAPGTIPSGNTVTVTATSAADSSKSVSATITINQAIAISMVPQPRAEMNVTSTAPFTAVVTNDPQNAGVNWTIACNSSHCGSLTLANGVASGSPTTYQAPASIPAGGAVTLTATSITDSSQAVSTTVMITQASTTLADGTYVFHLSGNDYTAANGESNYYVVGAFSVAGGLITGGEQDFVDFNDALADAIQPATSSISGTADGNLRIVLDTGDSALGANGVETLSAAPVSGSRALIGEYDLSATGTGTLDLQSSQAAPSGGYAFLASGVDHSAAAMAFGGILNVDSLGSISGTGSVLDLNDASLGSPEPAQSLSPSTVTGPGGSATPDAFGRVTFTLNPSNGSIGQIVLIGYVVDSGAIQLLETTDALGGTTGGIALAQGGNTGMFSTGSVSGLTYVAGAAGADANGPLKLAGAFAFSSTTNDVSGQATVSDLVSEISGGISAGTYLVDGTGRVTLTGLSGSTFDNASAQFYLDGNGNALMLSMDASDVIAGPAFQQTPGAALSGAYAVDADGAALMSGVLGSARRAHPEARSRTLFPWSMVGQAFSDMAGNVTGYDDFNVLTAPLTANVQLFGSATGSAEVLMGDLTGCGTAPTGPDTFVYYVIDNGRAFAIEDDATQLSLVYFEQSPSK